MLSRRDLPLRKSDIARRRNTRENTHAITKALHAIDTLYFVSGSTGLSFDRCWPIRVALVIATDRQTDTRVNIRQKQKCRFKRKTFQCQITKQLAMRNADKEMVQSVER